MKLFKKLSFAALTVAALGCCVASASVIEHVQAVMDSGATFDGHITFADHYTAILGVDGYLDGDVYGHDHLSWSLSIEIGPGILINFAGIDTADRIASVTVGDAADPSNVPEPGSIVLLGLGCAGLAAVRRRKR